MDALHKQLVGGRLSSRGVDEFVGLARGVAAAVELNLAETQSLQNGSLPISKLSARSSRERWAADLETRIPASRLFKGARRCLAAEFDVRRAHSGFIGRCRNVSVRDALVLISC